MTMRNTRIARAAWRARRAARNRGLVILAGLVLFAGLFVQVTMLARVSSQSKLASGLIGDIEELNAQVDNLELSINEYHKLNDIGKRAIQLGMQQADAASTRVVNVAMSGAGDASAQTASAAGAQGAPN